MTADTVTIGWYGPLSGPAAALGDDGRKGLQAAVNEVNAAGGIGGRKLKLIAEDDGYQPAKTVAAVKKLVENDQIFALVGPVGSPNTLAVLDYLGEKQVPLLFPYAQTQTLTRPTRPNVFTMLPTISDQVALIAEYLKGAGVEGLSFIYQNDEAGQEALEGLKAGVQNHGLELVGVVPFERGTKDFSASVLKLKQLGADDIVVGAISTDVALILKEANKLGWKPRFIGHGAVGDSATIRLAGELAEGLKALTLMAPLEDQSVGMSRYREALTAALPDAQPSIFSQAGYVAGLLFAEALRKVGPEVTRANLLKALETMNGFEIGGIMAPLQLGPDNHAANRSAAVIEVKGGKWVKISDWQILSK